MFPRERTMPDAAPVPAVWRWRDALKAGPPSSDVTGAPVGRDARLDMFRGLALVMIFINHVPGTVYEQFTNRNFGFSDAAEAFVFMSGMAAGLAYSNGFRGGPLWPAIARVWARARHLYFIHLAITIMALGIFAAAALWFGKTHLLATNNIAALFQQPLGVLIGLPLMSHQLGYLNILPLYILLLLATPAMLMLGVKRPMVLLGVSIALWMGVGIMRINLPNFPGGGGWFFNPLAWQLLFVVGLLCGVAMKQGRAFVPFQPMLFGLAAAFVVFVLLWVKVPAIGSAGRDMLGYFNEMGLPGHFTWFNKSYLDMPRMLHAFALFYVLASLTSVRHFAGTRYAAPLRLLGRFGLAVFATGTVLSLTGQAIKSGRLPDPLFDGLLLASGLALLLALAWSLDKTAAMRREAARPARIAADKKTAPSA